MSKTTIAEISTNIGSGITPYRKNESYWSSADVPWLKTEQVGEFEIYNTNEYISNLAVTENGMKLWKPKTITLAMYGEGKTRGRVSLLMREMTTNQACCNIEVDEKKATYLYVYYWLVNSYVRLRAISSGIRNNLNADLIREFPIDIPSISKQTNISNFLYRLDKKIVLNNTINTELEKVAKTLYNYWFVQFDFPNAKGKPYRTSGGKMEYNEVLKMEIPKGWKVKQLKEICRIKSGYPFSSKFYLKNGKFRLITIKNVQEDGVNLNVDSFLDTIPENMPDYCLLHPGDILMSLTGNVGRVGLMFENDCLLNQRVAVIQPVSETVKGYCYFLLKSDYIRAIVDNMASGSSQANLSPIDTENILLPFDSKVISDYDAKITPIVQHIVSLKMQNKELTGLRDFLLPLLMNGQVRVRDDNKKSPNDKDSLNHG